jgi:hypothetical protein
MNVEQARKTLTDIGLDWLALAVNRMGGIKLAARRLGVSDRTVAGWLEHGLASARFDQVVQLRQLADVPLEALARRLGPFPFAAELEGCARVIEEAESRSADA